MLAGCIGTKHTPLTQSSIGLQYFIIPHALLLSPLSSHFMRNRRQ